MVAPIEIVDTAEGEETPGMFQTFSKFATWATCVALVGLLLWAIAIAAVVATVRVFTTPRAQDAQPR